MRDFRGVISLSCKGDKIENTYNLLSKLSVFTLAKSLNGLALLAAHPANMTQAALLKAEGEKSEVTNSLLRLSMDAEYIDSCILPRASDILI